MSDLNFLVDHIQLQNFLNSNSEKIFGRQCESLIVDLKRAETYNPDSYNVLGKIRFGNELKEIRLSASKELSKKEEYEVMRFCYQNGLNSGSVLTPKPLAFFEELNLLIYENVPGEFLFKQLGDPYPILSKKVVACAEGLKRFHQLSLPDFKLWNSAKLFFCNDYEKRHLEEYFPNLGKNINGILESLKEKIDASKINCLCHGDFQPTNVIVEERVLHVLDLGLVTLLDKEHDLATFTCQLRVMLKRVGDYAHYDELSKDFLSSYGVFDKTKYELYSLLANLRILVTFTLTNRSIGNEEYMPFVYQFIEKDIDRLIGIKTHDEC